MLYTTKQVAKLTGKHITTIRHHARKNKMGKKIGRDWLYTAKDVKQIGQIEPGKAPTTSATMQHKHSSHSIVGSHARERKYPVRILAVVPHRSD